MNIGEVSRRTGLPAKTIRYYEDIELVKPSRTDNGYRVYSEDDVHNLAFLGSTRSLGFSVEDCRALLALYVDRDRSSRDVKEIALEHLHRVEQKIAGLEAVRETLQTLIASCAGDARPHCPILAGFEHLPGKA